MNNNYHNIIFSLLSNHEGLTALIGSKIYPVVIDQEKGYPAIAYTIKVEPVNIKGFPTKVEMVYCNFYAVSNDVDTSNDIAHNIRLALDHVGHQTIEDIQVKRTSFIMQDHAMFDDDVKVVVIPVQYSINLISNIQS